MACKIDLWADGNWWDALWCPYTDPSGFGMTGIGVFMVFGVFVGLYNWAEGLTLPAAWLALVAGYAISTLPGDVAKVVASVIAVAVTLGLYGLWRVAQ